MNDIKNKITNGLYILGVKDQDTQNLMTAAWLTQVSSEPFLIAAAVANHHYTAQLIKRSHQFTISILTGDQTKQAKACGLVSGRTHNKLADADTDTFHSIPIIKNSAGWLYLSVEQFHETGDHTLFIGKVMDSISTKSIPALYRSEQYRSK